MNNLEFSRWMSKYKYPGFWRRVGDWLNPNTRICEICGMRVNDVEVPLHITSRGGAFIHPAHIIFSGKAV